AARRRQHFVEHAGRLARSALVEQLPAERHLLGVAAPLRRRARDGALAQAGAEAAQLRLRIFPHRAAFARSAAPAGKLGDLRVSLAVGAEDAGEILAVLELAIGEGEAERGVFRRLERNRLLEPGDGRGVLALVVGVPAERLRA